MQSNIGLLLLRVFFGGMLFFRHGWGKLINFSTVANGFPDPMHVGSKISLGMVTFAEVFCALCVAVGLATRIACVPLIITFLVVVFLVLGATPLGQRELAMMYLCAFSVIALTGPGNFSVDHMMKNRR